MYAALRLRSQASLEHLCEAFGDITFEQLALNHKMAHHRALTTSDLPTYHSTASAPSLRSREPVEVLERPLTPLESGDAGHVKVVVRVRKFVKRGRAMSSRMYEQNTDTAAQSWTNSHHA